MIFSCSPYDINKPSLLHHPIHQPVWASTSSTSRALELWYWAVAETHSPRVHSLLAWPCPMSSVQAMHPAAEWQSHLQPRSGDQGEFPPQHGHGESDTETTQRFDTITFWYIFGVAQKKGTDNYGYVLYGSFRRNRSMERVSHAEEVWSGFVSKGIMSATWHFWITGIDHTWSYPLWMYGSLVWIRTMDRPWVQGCPGYGSGPYILSHIQFISIHTHAITCIHFPEPQLT